MIRILVVDDQNLIHEGIKVLLEKATEIEIVGAVKDGEVALERIAEVKPDVVLLDIDLPGINGLTVASKISFKFPEVKVIMLSSYEDESYVSQAMDSGAKGYLLKSVSAQELEWSIKLVYQGYSSFKSELLETFSFNESKPQNPPTEEPASHVTSLPASSLQGHQTVTAKPQVASSASATAEKQSSVNQVSTVPSTSDSQYDAELAKMEALLNRNHIHQQYSRYAARSRKSRGNGMIDQVKLNQIRKTISSFEFKLLVLLIMFTLGILIFVTLSYM